MDIAAVGDYLELDSLFGTPIPEPRIPGKRNRDGAPINKVNDDSILSDPHLLDTCFLNLNHHSSITEPV